MAVQIQSQSRSESCITSFVQLLTTVDGNGPSDLLKVALGISDVARADPNSELQRVPPKPGPPSRCPSRCPCSLGSSFTHSFGEQTVERMLLQTRLLEKRFLLDAKSQPWESIQIS